MKANQLQSETASFAKDAGFHDIDESDAGKQQAANAGQSYKHIRTWHVDRFTQKEDKTRGFQEMTDHQREVGVSTENQLQGFCKMTRSSYSLSSRYKGQLYVK